MPSRENYIIAVSGGVDSVVLLHKLVSVKPSHITYTVAHFDHGIRNDSVDDAKFVRALAKKYGQEFVTERVELGQGASEDIAREARYSFLRTVMKDKKASAIVTGHHQDDVLETMVVNMMRGTGPRGLIGFTKRNIIRPLINMTKQDIKKYAKEHSLEWREDSTNQDPNYMRNYVRASIAPKLEPKRTELFKIREKVTSNYIEIDDQILKLLVSTMHKGEVVRSRFVVYPYIVQKELMAEYLRTQGIEINKNMVEKAVLAAKTLDPGKHIELQKKTKLYANKKTVVLKSK